MSGNRIGQRIVHTEYAFCARCGETTAFPAGVRTPDGLSEVRTCENDCGQQITTPLLIWTEDKNAEVPSLRDTGRGRPWLWFQGLPPTSVARQRILRPRTADPDKVLDVTERGEQNWYPISRIGWFTDHIREGIDVTRGQIDLFAPALAEPYRLDDATVNRANRAYENQRDDMVLFRNQADRWRQEATTSEQRTAVDTFAAAIDELEKLTGEVLTMCATLAEQTIEKLIAKSDEEVGLDALMQLVRDGRI